MEITNEDLEIELAPETFANLYHSGDSFVLRLSHPTDKKSLGLHMDDSTADAIRSEIRRKGPVNLPAVDPAGSIGDRWLRLAQKLEDEPNFRGQAATLIAWARDLITDSGDYERRRRFARMLDSIVELVKEMR